MTPDNLNTLFALSDNAADAATDEQGKPLAGLKWVAFEAGFREGFQGGKCEESLVEWNAYRAGYLAGWDNYGRRWADFADPVRLATCAAFLTAFQDHATAQGEARRAAA